MFAKEDYVSLETAKMLKEKGFNEPCNAWYGINGSEFASADTSNHNYTFPKDSRYSKPTLYEAHKWIWERHKMFVSAAPNSPFTAPLEFFFWIDFPTETIDVFGSLITEEHFPSYQQALDAGIRYALNLIKKED